MSSIILSKKFFMFEENPNVSFDAILDLSISLVSCVDVYLDTYEKTSTNIYLTFYYLVNGVPYYIGCKTTLLEGVNTYTITAMDNNNDTFIQGYITLSSTNTTECYTSSTLIQISPMYIQAPSLGSTKVHVYDENANDYYVSTKYINFVDTTDTTVYSYGANDNYRLQHVDTSVSYTTTTEIDTLISDTLEEYDSSSDTIYLYNSNTPLGSNLVDEDNSLYLDLSLKEDYNICLEKISNNVIVIHTVNENTVPVYKLHENYKEHKNTFLNSSANTNPLDICYSSNGNFDSDIIRTTSFGDYDYNDLNSNAGD